MLIRAFLAIALPDAIRSVLTVQQFLLPLPHKADPGQFHLTLVFLGEVPGPVLEAAHEAFGALRLPRFSLQLAGLGLFGGARPHAAWAGVQPSEPLMRVQAKLERAARVAGIEVPSRRFVPHVTLGRFAPPLPEQAMRLERAVAAGASWQAGAMQVEDVRLYRSVLHPKGSRHDELARYPCDG